MCVATALILVIGSTDARAAPIFPPVISAPGQPRSIPEGTNPVFTITVSNPNFEPITLIDVRTVLTFHVGGPDPSDTLIGLEVLGGTCRPFPRLLTASGARIYVYLHAPRILQTRLISASVISE